MQGISHSYSHTYLISFCLFLIQLLLKRDFARVESWIRFVWAETETAIRINIKKVYTICMQCEQSRAFIIDLIIVRIIGEAHTLILCLFWAETVNCLWHTLCQSVSTFILLFFFPSICRFFTHLFLKIQNSLVCFFFLYSWHAFK